jgi:TatD DNase family protein
MICGIDAHIHLDMYEELDAARILADLSSKQVQGLIAVSMHLESCKATEILRMRYPNLVYAVFGYHPEQDIPGQEEREQLFDWIIQHSSNMAAIGEVGLPYYKRQEAEERGIVFEIEPYLKLLDSFIALSASLDKPIVLHAVYEDADLACDLLEKHRVKHAHFHWFKGSEQTVQRMISGGYNISITPDVIYEPEIQWLAARYPIELMMVETDGPWPFEGPFEGVQTNPGMIINVIKEIAKIKNLSEQQTASILLNNTRQFYRLDIQ